MGQYWKPVNLDKKEFINPHKLGAGAKLWEQLANSPGTQGALIILLAALPEVRGGGDFDIDTNWHGPERVDMTKAGEMPDSYPEIAKRTIGRWAGDRVVLIGDYAEDGDLSKEKSKIPASEIYDRCISREDYDRYYSGEDAEQCDFKREDCFEDITEDVKKVIEHELCGKFEGEGISRFIKK